MKKVGIAGLIIGAFIIGGLALNAFDVDAFGWSKHKANSGEWKEKMEAFKGMTSEEMLEHKELCLESGDCTYFKGSRDGHFKMLDDGLNYEITKLDNGIQMIITSDDPEIVEKLHNKADSFNK